MIPVSRVIARTGATDEQDIANRIEGATATLGRELLRYLGPVLERVEVTQVDPCGTVIVLEEPVAEGTDVVIETRDTVFDDWEELAELDDDAKRNYVVEGREIMLRTAWGGGKNTVRVTYSAGYNEGEGPTHFQELVLAMVVNGWNADQSSVISGGGLKSETIGDYKYENFTAAELEAAAAAIGDSWQGFVKKWKRMLV